ncbi:hypothetical protein N0V91_005515 [Didymella pomorum]|uniref:Uncharacterized protein n=1 Tax=Didymella pomorum TaxID=749634 RepID=A0A9W8ZEZ7_9PLEO|nr:hypothetical protein N0V91_005515 [Didymella pomorum]
MSRLWRDTVTAAFNDKSACVEGSTGYSNSTKAAPESDVKVQYSVNLDWEEPDAALIPYDLDLSGGPYASLLGAKSNTSAKRLRSIRAKISLHLSSMASPAYLA